jgi:hypothetical protein
MHVRVTASHAFDAQSASTKHFAELDSPASPACALTPPEPAVAAAPPPFNAPPDAAPRPAAPEPPATPPMPIAPPLGMLPLPATNAPAPPIDETSPVPTLTLPPAPKAPPAITVAPAPALAVSSYNVALPPHAATPTSVNDSPHKSSRFTRPPCQPLDRRYVACRSAQRTSAASPRER